MGDKPRKLLVRLESEAIAAELLLKSRNLRYSHDSYVSENIYFNADISKDEAKEAYQRRQERRRGSAQTDGRLVTRNSASNNRVNINLNTLNSSVSTVSNSIQFQNPSVVTSKSVTFTNSTKYGSNKSHATTSNSSNLIVCSGDTLGKSTSTLLNPSATVYDPFGGPEQKTMDGVPSTSSDVGDTNA